ncbi:hypothetical protein BC835DRAFT_1305605 [Cytidiella melzeri]|nr:hypothetical protein BC835DRAFT_1305605 [Cytidiella melzeri]
MSATRLPEASPRMVRVDLAFSSPKLPHCGVAALPNRRFVQALPPGGERINILGRSVTFVIYDIATGEVVGTTPRIEGLPVNRNFLRLYPISLHTGYLTTCASYMVRDGYLVNANARELRLNEYTSRESFRSATTSCTDVRRYDASRRGIKVNLKFETVFETGAMPFDTFILSSRYILRSKSMMGSGCWFFHLPAIDSLANVLCNPDGESPTVQVANWAREHSYIIELDDITDESHVHLWSTWLTQFSQAGFQTSALEQRGDSNRALRCRQCSITGSEHGTAKAGNRQ